MAQSGYDMYFDKCLFPVTPEKISIKINGNNKTVNLINEGEINILKKTYRLQPTGFRIHKRSENNTIPIIIMTDTRPCKKLGG